MADTPTGASEVVWHIQKRLQEKGHKVTIDGDLGPKSFWDNSETLRAVLAALGGPVRSTTLPNVTSRSDTGKRVFIDVGHGWKPDGFDPGAVHSKVGITEHILNTILANSIASELRARGIQVTVADGKLSNYDAGRAAKGHDVLISCHHNAASGPAQYALACYDDRHGSASDKTLATQLASVMASTLGIPDKGAKAMGLAVLSGARSAGVPTAVLIEPYFIHAQTPENPAPASMNDWSQRAGRAVGEAIAAHLGVA